MPVVRRTAPTIARGFVYVLLLVVCTVSAAYGGYVVGTRTQPAESSANPLIGGDQDKATAVAKAVAAQKRADRAKRRAALRDFAIFQRERFAAELQQKLSEQHMADGQAAARAYSRGRQAGLIRGKEKAAEDAAAATATAGTPRTLQGGAEPSSGDTTDPG